MYRFRLPLLLLALLAPAAGYTAVVVTPSNPYSTQVIQATIDYPGLCAANPTTTISGNVIRTTIVLSSCIAGPPSFLLQQRVTFGPLPAGTYTYEAYWQFQGSPTLILHGQTTIVVADPPVPVPTADRMGLLIMLFAISAVALTLMRRLL